MLGVGVNGANARNFSYLASTGMSGFQAIPRRGSAAADDLAWADGRDILIAMTCRPYRTEVIEAVEIAGEQGVPGGWGYPTARRVRSSSPPKHGFAVAADTPQFFPSSVATIALLETLLSFVIACSEDDVVERVETFHRRRHELGMYEEDPT